MTQSNGHESEHTFTPHIPAQLASRLRDAVPRQWLRNRIEDVLLASPPEATKASRTILLVGEPGSGKSILAAQLAAAWRCPAYFSRAGSTGGVIWRDAKNFLVSLGLQLRAQYGPQIFGPPSLEVRGSLHVGRVSAQGKAIGFEAGVVSLSPFRRVLVDVDVSADEISGEAFVVRIAELRDGVANMTVPQLAQDAVIQPMQRLAELRPNERVRIIVDAVDESLELADSIPFGDESPVNVDWVLTTRPGDHLNRFIDRDGASKVWRLNLSDPEFTDSSLEDARKYAETLLTKPSFSAVLESWPAPNRSITDLALDLAQASRGNFLYLYHLIGAIRKEAEGGSFELLSRPANSLPEGLDGIYRYFLTGIILPKASLRDWVEFYAPVLGVLAVARAPLGSSRLAAFSGQDSLVVDRVVGTVGSFLETTAQAKDLAYSFYHPSFADFLLVQDRSRNPYPLRPPGDYHALVADYYGRLGESAWAGMTDRYALIHLPTHLLESGRVAEACRLLHSAFGQRQRFWVGAAQTWADIRSAAHAAAAGDQDELFFEMVATGVETGAAIKEQWESGHYVLGFLSDDRTEILDRTGHQQDSPGASLGSMFSPWSDFLVVERLMDLGAVAEARQMLRQVARGPWLGYEPRNYGGINLHEGSSWDFVLETQVVSFLGRVAQLDADLALTLTKRFYTDEPRLPNARTAWREVINNFLAWRSDCGPERGSAATAAQSQKLAEATCKWLRAGGHTLGWAGVTQSLFRLVACTLPLADPLWVANAILLGVACRFAAKQTIQGASERRGSEETDERPGEWAALADVLTGLQLILENTPMEKAKQGEQGDTQRFGPESGPGDAGKEDTGESSDDGKGGLSTLKAVLKECIHQVVERVPPIETPTSASYGPRADYLGHLAFALNQAGAERWREYAQAALAACALDLATNDPPRWAVARALMWLRRTSDLDILSGAQSLIARFNFAGEVESEEAKAKRSAANGSDAVPLSLKQVTEARDSFERGRMVLALWRSGAAGLQELEAALAHAYRAEQATQQSRSKEATPRNFTELLAESLTAVIARSAPPWAGDAIARLEECRRPERRKVVVFDEAALQRARLQALAARKDWEQFRLEADRQRGAALASRDYTKLLGICMLAINFDPDLAQQWYAQLRGYLKKPRNRGMAVVHLVAQLATLWPERVNDLGREWAKDLPALDPRTGISLYQLRLCEKWAPLEDFRPSVIEHLNYFADVLPGEVKRIRGKAAQLEQARHQKDASQTEEASSGAEEDDEWSLVGKVLRSASHVVIRESDVSIRAAKRIVKAVAQALNQTASETPGWQVTPSVARILEQMTDEAEGYFEPGPIADAVLDLYSVAVRGSGEPGADSEPESTYDFQRRQNILLGLSLAARLKRAKSQWAVAQFSSALRMWESLVAGTPTSKGSVESMAEAMVDVFASALDRGFRSSRERELFGLTRELTAWCTAEPPSRDRLTQLQSLVSKVRDADLRSLLLAAVACGWLQLDEVKRTSYLVQLAKHDSLSKAGFYKRVLFAVRKSCESGTLKELPILKALVLDLILLTPLQAHGDALGDAIGAWISLRGKELAAKSGDNAEEYNYLERLVNWTESRAEQGIGQSQVG
jgi:hypothetical protein